MRSGAVFVNSIVKTPTGRIIVEASNGSHDGPPFARWEIDTTDAMTRCAIGKRYKLTIEEWPE